MIDRRSFVGSVGALLLAPAVVQASSLMRVRGNILPIEWCHYGFVQRLYVDCHINRIRMLQNTGMSAHEIAADFNRRNSLAINNSDWDAGRVLSVVRLDARIRSQDKMLRVWRMLHKQDSDGPRSAILQTSRPPAVLAREAIQ
jgi:hypothetical protein